MKKIILLHPTVLPVLITVGVIGIVGLAVSSCVTVSTAPLVPGELRLLSMRVPETIIRGNPYAAFIIFEAEGEPQIKEACFSWSGEGPYCFNVMNAQYGSPGAFTVRLLTNNPGSYGLDCYVKYFREGKIKMTNQIGIQIYVR